MPARTSRPVPGSGIVPKRTEDIHLELRANDLADRTMAALIAEFEAIDLENLHDTAIQIRRDYLCRKLGVDNRGLTRLMAEARSQKLLRMLSVDKHPGAWVEKCSEKGYLVVMASVEKGDVARDDLVERFRTEIGTLGSQLASEGHTLKRIVLVPNAHITSRNELETDSGNATEVIARLRSSLEEDGFVVHEASFGFGKRVNLTILGHARSYTFHKI